MSNFQRQLWIVLMIVCAGAAFKSFLEARGIMGFMFCYLAVMLGNGLRKHGW